MNELFELQKIRRKLGVTQKELAKMAGVSQSLIAKIESNKINPSYVCVKKIFDTLNNLTKQNKVKLEDIMNKKVISISSKTKIKDAIELMKKHDISQLPVIDKKTVIGLVSETTILNNFDSLNPEYTVDAIIEDAPPIVSSVTGQEVVSCLLKYYPIVLISSKGAICGLVSKADILKRLVDQHP